MEFLETLLVKEIVNPILYIILGFSLYFVISGFIKRTSKLYLKHGNTRKKQTIVSLIDNILKYLIAVIVILLILEVYKVNTGAIIASLGAVGLVVGLAFQDLIKDFIAGIFIIFDDQYSVGDVVTINGFKGEVTALGLKSTKLKAVNGDVLIVSNGKISEIINHSLTYSLAIVDVDIAYSENIDHVLDILEDLAISFSKENKMVKEINVLGVTNLGDNGVRIRVTAKTVSQEHFEVERNLRKSIKNRFDLEGIEIPYPQVVIHDGKRV